MTHLYRKLAIFHASANVSSGRTGFKKAAEEEHLDEALISKAINCDGEAVGQVQLGAHGWEEVDDDGDAQMENAPPVANQSTSAAEHDPFYAEMYSKADPFIGALKADPEDKSASAAIQGVIKEIHAYNQEKGVKSKQAGSIDVTTLTGFYSEALLKMGELKANPHDGDARERLDAISNSLGNLIRGFKYPPAWNIDLDNIFSTLDAGTRSPEAPRNTNQVPFQGHAWTIVKWTGTQNGRSHRVLLERKTQDGKINVYVLIAKSQFRQAAQQFITQNPGAKMDLLKRNQAIQLKFELTGVARIVVAGRAHNEAAELRYKTPDINGQEHWMTVPTAEHHFGASLATMEAEYEKRTGISIGPQLRRGLNQVERSNGQLITSLRKPLGQPMPSVASILDALTALSLEDQKQLQAAIGTLGAGSTSKALEPGPGSKALQTGPASKALEAGPASKALEAGPKMIASPA